MRILFLVHRLPYPPNKGDKIRSFAELRAMSAFADVDVFCFCDDPNDRESAGKLGKFCKAYYFEILGHVRARMRATAALLNGGSFSLAYFSSSTMEQQVSRALSTGRYDCAVVFCSSMAQYLVNSSVPWVLDMVDVDSDKWEQYAERQTGLMRWVWRNEGRRLAAYEREIVQRAARVLVCTEKEADVLRRVAPGATNIRAVQNSIDLEYHNAAAVEVPSTIGRLSPYVIFPGQMDYFPNVEAALRFYRECLPRLRSLVPRVRFVIAGRNPARSLRRLQSDPSVHVTGAVDDMRPWIKGASAAVVPLQIARGIQNKILECLAIGTPVVCGSKCAEPLPSAVARLLSIDDDPNAMAERLADLIGAQQRLPLDSTRSVLSDYFGHQRLASELREILRTSSVAQNVGSTAALETGVSPA